VLDKTKKATKEIVASIENGGYSRSLSNRLGEMEKECDELEDRLLLAP
jgi:uncharacterized protein Yka (UPF0111/DUF47 family)